ncbi:Fur family transcriptional regulator [Anaerotignum sp.]|uniref:Fur family transcriptional regulator n=1 Tax=Anaerotignum sp. TaxID=2039241 RepID=UPI0037367416
MTRNGQRILDIILQSQDHLTAEQIFWQLKQTAPKTVLATVYNNLHTLCEEGLIRKISVEDGPDRYDKAAKHDHLVCKKCGALLDMTFSDLTESLSAQLGEPILSYDLKVSYLCPACRKKETSYQEKD